MKIPVSRTHSPDIPYTMSLHLLLQPPHSAVGALRSLSSPLYVTGAVSGSGHKPGRVQGVSGQGFKSSHMVWF